MIDHRNIMDQIKGMDNDRIKLWYNARTLPFAICVDNLAGGLNFGTIVRTANAFAANEIYYCGKKHWDRRSAVGVYNYTTINYLNTYDELKKLKAKYHLVGVENNIYRSKVIDDYHYKDNSLFLFGEEGTGLNNEVLDMCDDIVYVPQSGTVRSLNVSVCAGIVMADYVRKFGK